MDRGTLELVLFAHSPAVVPRALAAGVESMIVDWEWRGKEARQEGAQTEINRDTPEDLARLARLGVPRRFCRLNRFGPWSGEEIETAVAGGATHLLLPMVESPVEVEEVLRRVAGRSAVGILVETSAGVRRARELARLPLALIYVGLNDLAISRGTASIFDALVDGTVDAVRQAFSEVPFGVAGATVVDRGEPIPSPLLLAELARLRCAFTFVRRSFWRDVVGRDWGLEIAGIQELWRRLARRTPAELARDREAFSRAVAAARPTTPLRSTER